MSEKCNNSCSSCTEDCNDRKQKIDFSAKQNELSHIGKVIGIVSGKGGVGKSLVTSLLAVSMNRLGYKTAVLDGDITGPSIPKAFGIKEKASSNELSLFPVKSKTGIEIMSINLLLENETDPVVWRGPILSNTVKQFWTDVVWGDVDYMFVDLPPGTGDVPLTVFQSLPIDGIVIVTSPQELVSMIVGKAVKMAEMMSVPILGIVENMSYFLCPDNNKKYELFGESHIKETAKKHGLNVIAQIPVDPKLSAASDKGMIELFKGDWLDILADGLKSDNMKKIKIAVAGEGDNVTEHFGHCTNFLIFDVENNKIVGSESIKNPGHKPGYLPNYLADMGVKVIISGGLGEGAIDIFNERDVEVIVGAKGNGKRAAQDYLNGTLKTTGSVCHEHQHADECGE